VFTFHIENGKSSPEDVKAACESADAARAEALHVLIDSVSDFTPDFWLRPVWSLRVLDEEGKKVLTLDLSGKAD
jgi:hypothetical protein